MLSFLSFSFVKSSVFHRSPYFSYNHIHKYCDNKIACWWYLSATRVLIPYIGELSIDGQPILVDQKFGAEIFNWLFDTQNVDIRYQIYCKKCSSYAFRNPKSIVSMLDNAVNVFLNNNVKNCMNILYLWTRQTIYQGMHNLYEDEDFLRESTYRKVLIHFYKRKDWMHENILSKSSIVCDKQIWKTVCKPNVVVSDPKKFGAW